MKQQQDQQIKALNGDSVQIAASLSFQHKQSESEIELSAAQEEQLAREIKAGSETALEQLVNANRRLVLTLAQSYQHQGLSLEDLVNEGNIGLVKAASRFNATRGIQFKAYAQWWIKQSILQALAEHSKTVRLSAQSFEEISKIKKEYFKLEHLLNREPSAAELGESLQKKVADWLTVEEPNSEDDETEEELAPRHQIRPVQSKLSPKISLQQALPTLTPREGDVVRNYFGIGTQKVDSLDELGQRFDLTSNDVKELIEKVFRKLRYQNRTLV